MVMLSAVDCRPGLSVATVHGTINGCRTWSGRTDCGGSIGSVTDLQPSSYSYCESTTWAVSFYTN